LERSWPNEYARTERIEQVNEPADDKKVSLNVFYDTGGVGMEKLTAFPLHPSMGYDTPEQAVEKQKRLVGEESAPEPEKISDGPPPKAPPPAALTGRIREIPISRNGK
jgi:hypothetical protein